jgi:undecaprenyl-diphosphatase
MTAFQALVIAIVQGATELFPVSSLGHAVTLPALFRWHLDQHAPSFLPFLVMLHVGTATALLGYFWRDWLAILGGILGMGSEHHKRESRRVFLLIVIATIPAVILGFTLEHFFRNLFGVPLVASIFLIVNGLMLMAGERSRARATRPLSELSTTDALVIGLWQCLALIPGMSRSGATMVGGLARGINHEDAAHFSFLIATPIILGATVLEVPKLLRAGVPHEMFGIAAMGAVAAGVVAWLSTWFLMRYFHRAMNSPALDPFGWYSIGAGAAMTVWFLFA